MNLNSKILKLSIIFTLILVLIPVASAMDSEEAFYQEYEVEEVQEFVEEYNDIEVEYTHIDMSSQSDHYESDGHVEESNTCQQTEHVKEDAVEISELNLNSVQETHDIIDQNFEKVGYDVTSNDLKDLTGNVNEACSDDLTYETISVNYQGSIFISEYDTTFSYILINQILYNEMTTTLESKSLNRSVVKVMELKNNLLIKQDIQTCFDENEIDELDDFIVCIANTSTDFAYSIDNSVIGDGCAIFVGNSCFLKFYPCFDAIFCCKLLDVENFSCGDFSNCLGLFCCNFAVGYREHNLSLMIENLNQGSIW